jgi:hypothetical protein
MEKISIFLRSAGNTSRKAVMLLLLLTPVCLRCFTQCAAPTGLVINSMSGDSVSFSWNAVDGALTYEFKVSGSKDAPEEGFSTTLTRAVVYYFGEDSGPYIHVRAVCNLGSSDWASICKPVPGSLAGTGRYCINEVLNIGMPSTAKSQQYLWYEDGFEVNGPVDGDGDSKSYNPVMTPERTGHYTVIATSDCGTVEFGDVTIMLRTAPTGLGIVSVYTDSVSFKWDTYPDIPGTNSDDSWQYSVSTDSVPSELNALFTSSTSASAGDLVPGSIYYLHVAPQCGNGGIPAWSTLEFATDHSTCPGGAVTFTGADRGEGFVYQWQVDKGAGFVDIINDDLYNGANELDLNILGAPSSLSGNRYRCVATNGSDTITGSASRLRFVVTWTGSFGTAWNNTDNWSCTLGLPDADTDVIVPPGLTNYPVVDGNTSCRSLTIENGATVTVTGGVHLEITGNR